MEPISIRYRLTEAEFMKACSAHWSTRRPSTAFNVIMGGLGIVAGVAALPLFRWLGGVLCAAGGALILVIWLRYFLWRRAFREARKYTDDIFVTFSDDGIHVESADGKSDLYWAFYGRYLDTPDQVLLYASTHMFSVIPKRSFQDEQTVKRFLELLEKKSKKVR